MAATKQDSTGSGITVNGDILIVKKPTPKGERVQLLQLVSKKKIKGRNVFLLEHVHHANKATFTLEDAIKLGFGELEITGQGSSEAVSAAFDKLT